VRTFGDPRLYALNLVSNQFAQSAQPLVPERLFVMGDHGNGTASNQGFGLLNQLIALLVGEKAGMNVENAEKTTTKIQKSIVAMQQQFADGASHKPEAQTILKP